MKKVLRSIVLILSLIIGVQSFSFSQTAVDSSSRMGQTTTYEHEDHNNWGLLGLLGLIGLAGLRRRNVVERKVDYVNPQNPQNR